MSQAYTPGLKVTPWMRHRVRRILPISGEVKKTVGETVGAIDVVAETFMPGNVTPINVANMLSMPPAITTSTLSTTGSRSVNMACEKVPALNTGRRSHQACRLLLSWMKTPTLPKRWTAIRSNWHM